MYLRKSLAWILGQFSLISQKRLIVWHKGLIQKLQRNEISGNLLMLLNEFLHNDRKQRVILNGEAFEWETASPGVPQGSVLVPLPF